MDNKRELAHKGREIVMQHDWEFCSAVYYKGKGTEPVYFLRNEDGEFIETTYGNWYMAVAIEKLDKIKVDRHLINESLILEYRWAIREGFNHMLDRNLVNFYDHPRNKNTIQGVKSYIKMIEKKSEEEMKAIRES